MSVEPIADEDEGTSASLARRGFFLRTSVVPPALVAALVAATDEAVTLEADDFPSGDEQHGRLLFAPSHGGAFVSMLELDDLFAPIEAVLGDDAIIYTMTTSVLRQGVSGPVESFHTDFPADRPPGLALAAMVLLDPFDESTGATEFAAVASGGLSEPTADEGVGHVVLGEPGDVCYFDPQVPHRSGRNRSIPVRRAVLVEMVPPWLKQRFDVESIVGEDLRRSMAPVAARRLGLSSIPPGSTAEFKARRHARPWT